MLLLLLLLKLLLFSLSITSTSSQKKLTDDTPVAPITVQQVLFDELQLERGKREIPNATTWQAEFKPSRLEMHMGNEGTVNISVKNVLVGNEFAVIIENTNVAKLGEITFNNSALATQLLLSIHVDVNAIFLGKTQLYVARFDRDSKALLERSSNETALIITRPQRVIDYVFTGSIILLVSLLYINFGAALDVTVLRSLIVRPVGPIIGFLTQFMLMPVLSYGLGLLIFPDNAEMQLGLFFTGVSPSGGASNMWTVILGGNVNLSVLMTSISNVAAFAVMPLWIFTLGQLIFARANLQVPYANIASYAVALVVPLAIGLAIQKWCPRVTRVLVRWLKPISSGLILFIIVFAIITNLYIFELFSWQIVVAGLALPWLGYMIAWLVAKLLRQNPIDSLTIAIETGIQNTGIAIFLLRSLEQPEADLTAVIPVSVAIMTPLPLLCLYAYRRLTARGIKDGTIVESESIVQQRNASE